MRIIIIGDGKVGYKLAKQLSAEKYDIIMIDSNENKLRFAMDRLDIACVTGDGADAEVLKQADVAHADLVIACTSADECNMLSCLIARKLGARHTIARVRNPIYYRQIGLLKEDLHLSMAVNPELIVADEISRLLLFPDASQVETFVKGRVELIELPVAKGSSLFLGNIPFHFLVIKRPKFNTCSLFSFFYMPSLIFCLLKSTPSGILIPLDICNHRQPKGIDSAVWL